MRHTLLHLNCIDDPVALACAVAWRRADAKSGEGTRDAEGDVVDRRVQ